MFIVTFAYVQILAFIHFSFLALMSQVTTWTSQVKNWLGLVNFFFWFYMYETRMFILQSGKSLISLTVRYSAYPCICSILPSLCFTTRYSFWLAEYRVSSDSLSRNRNIWNATVEYKQLFLSVEVSIFSIKCILTHRNLKIHILRSWKLSLKSHIFQGLNTENILSLAVGVW